MRPDSAYPVSSTPPRRCVPAPDPSTGARNAEHATTHTVDAYSITEVRVLSNRAAGIAPLPRDAVTHLLPLRAYGEEGGEQKLECPVMGRSCGTSICIVIR